MPFIMNKSLPAGRQAVVLLSGGLDSAVALYVAKHKGYEVYALSFDYGQRHGCELKAARSLSKKVHCNWKLLSIDLPWKGSSLLDNKLKIPESSCITRIGNVIPSTYVPARNTIFLSFALSYAEAIGASAVFIGANALDYSGYPDCRPQYFKAFNRLALLATKCALDKNKIKIQTPLVNLTKSQIIRLGSRLGVPFELTWSCYKGANKPCGKCDSCLLRAKGFKEAGEKDPALISCK